MRVSHTNSGRLIIMLSPEERQSFKGPYALAVSRGDNPAITLYRDEKGMKGGDHRGEWKIEFMDAATKTMPRFGIIKLRPLLGEDKLTAILPEVDQLPKPMAKHRKNRKTAVTVSNEVANYHAPPLGLPELIKQINAAREACPDNMVFSTDGDGYLRVTVEYGRG